MTISTKTLSNSIFAAFFSLAFSAALVLGAVGPAINISPSTVAQGQIA